MGSIDLLKSNWHLTPDMAPLFWLLACISNWRKAQEQAGRLLLVLVSNDQIVQVQEDWDVKSEYIICEIGLSHFKHLEEKGTLWPQGCTRAHGPR